MKPARQTALIPDIPAQPAYGQDPASMKKFQQMVLAYYRDHGRDLAWRRTTDPYHILVSEIMLQQTQVGRVEVKYPEFLSAFPDFPSLAAAPLPDLLSAWQGMGYNRRALALKQSAVRVINEFGGELPADPEVLSTFPGIGKATASSICAFAFNMPVVFIETNIRRVFIHFFFQDGETVSDKDLVVLVEKALYRDDPRTWYNALMDLGTDLKTRVPNPNRRSAGYTRQTAFEGSDRKIRGEIIRFLLAGGRMTGKEIANHVPGDTGRISRILRQLQDEGFVMEDGQRYTIAHE